MSAQHRNNASPVGGVTTAIRVPAAFGRGPTAAWLAHRHGYLALEKLTGWTPELSPRPASTALSRVAACLAGDCSLSFLRSGAVLVQLAFRPCAKQQQMAKQSRSRSLLFDRFHSDPFSVQARKCAPQITSSRGCHPRSINAIFVLALLAVLLLFWETGPASAQAARRALGGAGLWERGILVRSPFPTSLPQTMPA